MRREDLTKAEKRWQKRALFKGRDRGPSRRVMGLLVLCLVALMIFSVFVVLDKGAA